MQPEVHDPPGIQIEDDIFKQAARQCETFFTCCRIPQINQPPERTHAGCEFNRFFVIVCCARFPMGDLSFPILFTLDIFLTSEIAILK